MKVPCNFLQSGDLNIEPNIRFEQLNLDDKRILEMHEYSKQESFYSDLEHEPHKNLHETEDYMKSLLTRVKEGSHGGESLYWSIIDIKEDKLIGSMGFVGIKRKQLSACTTIGLSPDYRTKGRAIEAIVSLVNYGFKDLGFHRIWAITHITANSVVKMHEMLGFQKEGIFRDYYYKHGKFTNAVYLACLDKEYSCYKALNALKFLRIIKN